MKKYYNNSYICKECGEFLYRAKYDNDIKVNKFVLEQECFNFKRAIKYADRYEFIIYCPKCLKEYVISVNNKDL